jgi:chromosome segregation ATPase
VRRALAQLDEERDGLQAALDQQQEAATQVQREQAGYERRIRRLEEEAQDEQSRAKAAAAALGKKEREVRALQSQIAGLQHDGGELVVRSVAGCAGCA